jgi:hypothetical protein
MIKFQKKNEDKEIIIFLGIAESLNIK